MTNATKSCFTRHGPEYVRGQFVLARPTLLTGKLQTRFGAARMPVIQPHRMPARIQPQVAGELAR